MERAALGEVQAPNALQYRLRIFDCTNQINADQNSAFFSTYLKTFRNQTFLDDWTITLARDTCSFLNNCWEVAKTETVLKILLIWIYWTEKQTEKLTRKTEFLSKNTSFLPLKFEYTSYIFLIPSISLPFMTLKSTGFFC